MRVLSLLSLVATTISVTTAYVQPVLHHVGVGSMLLDRRAFMMTSIGLGGVSPFMGAQVTEDAPAPSNDIIEKHGSDIYFYSSVNTKSCYQLHILLNQAQEDNKRMQQLGQTQQPAPINLFIKSTGGSLLDAFSTYDFMRACKVPIHTHINSYCCSAATLLSIAGHTRYISRNSFMLLHQLSIDGISGKYNYVKQEVENLDMFMQTLRNIYMERTRLSSSELDDILYNETWLDASKSNLLGFVDIIEN